MNKWKSICMPVFLMSLIILSGCMTNSNQVIEDISDEVVESVSDYEEQVVTVQVGDIIKQKIYDAQIAPGSTELAFPEGGTFSNYEVALGDHVKKGQILARSQVKRLNETIKDQEKSLKKLKSDYEYNKRHYNSDIEMLSLELKLQDLDDMTRLSKRQEIEKQTILRDQAEEMYQLQLKKMENDIQELKDTVATNLIIAPHDGVVIFRLTMYEGNGFSDKDKMIAITDESQKYVATANYVSEGTAKRMQKMIALKDGKEYSLTYHNMSDEMYNSLKANNLSIYSSFSLDNDDTTLSFGEYVKLILESRRVENVLIIPKTTVNKDVEGLFVYLEQDGKKVKTFIKVSASDDVNYEVTEGLKEGDVIYVNQ